MLESEPPAPTFGLVFEEETRTFEQKQRHQATQFEFIFGRAAVVKVEILCD